MNPRAYKRFLGIASLLLAAVGLHAAGPQITANAPVKNFSLPSFDEQGFRTMLIRGREAMLVNASEVKLADMTLTLFSGDAEARVETVFVSPSARVLVDKRIVFGDETVRVISDEFDLLGTDWRYDHDKKTILISKQARVVFHIELKDIVK